MKYILWGYTNETQRIAERNKDIVGFADNNASKIGLEYAGKEVYSAQKVKRLYDSKQIDGVLIPDFFREAAKTSIICDCELLGINSIFLLKNETVEKLDIPENKQNLNTKQYNIVLWHGRGSDECLSYILARQKNVHIRYIGTDIITLHNSSIRGIPVVYISELKKVMDEEMVVLLPTTMDLLELESVVRELHLVGIKNICKVPYGFKIDRCTNAEEMLIPYEEREELMVLQYMVAFHCNLNCKGCSHFSPLVKNAIMADKEMVQRDLERLSKQIKNIGHISMLGGEPLLNSDLGQILLIAKEYYPDSQIEILTNGILVPKFIEETQEIIKKTGCVISITQYPGMDDFYLKVIEKLKECGIRYKINTGKQKQAFSKLFIENDNSEMEIKFASCTSKRCVSLYNGKIATCYLPITISHYDEYFGTHWYNENDLLDIHKEGTTGKHIMEFLGTPTSICKNCLNGAGKFVWEKADKNPKREDWTIM